jgi:hypothetical protein
MGHAMPATMSLLHKATARSFVGWNNHPYGCTTSICACKNYHPRNNSGSNTDITMQWSVQSCHRHVSCACPQPQPRLPGYHTWRVRPPSKAAALNVGTSLLASVADRGGIGHLRAVAAARDGLITANSVWGLASQQSRPRPSLQSPCDQPATIGYQRQEQGRLTSSRRPAAS